MSWSFASPQKTPNHGGRDFPSVRYSASSVEYRGELIVTHGYFYNHAIRHPAWQSNAWAFNFGSRKWRKIHEGETAGAPSARYSCSAVLHDDALYLFGGDDGGHKKSMFNYIFQAWFNELWRFDLRGYTWQQVRPSGPKPVKRALHGAVAIGDSMYVYGGLELADTWRYDFGPQSWSMVSAPPADTDTRDGSHPGRRHAFAMAAAGNGGFFVFGGCRHVRGMRPMAFDDLWHYDIGGNAWAKKEAASGAGHPSARSHLSMIRLSTNYLLLYGGALCIPGCTCYGDSWLYKVDANAWQALNASDPPIHR
jgi:N-acetylneuraminic acid mutarotase